MTEIVQSGVGLLLVVVAILAWGLLCSLRRATITDKGYNLFAKIGGVFTTISLILVIFHDFILYGREISFVLALLGICLSIYYWVMNFKFSQRLKEQKLNEKAKLKAKNKKAKK
jgi:hypothetical protein